MTIRTFTCSICNADNASNGHILIYCTLLLGCIVEERVIFSCVACATEAKQRVEEIMNDGNMETQEEATD